MKRNHYLPSSYISRITNMKRGDSLYWWDIENKIWNSKKIEKMHSNIKYLWLTKKVADEYFQGDQLYLEKNFGFFENEWSIIWDEFKGTILEKQNLLLKMYKNIEYRDPLLLNKMQYLKINKPIKDLNEAKNIFQKIKSNISDKNMGDNVLGLIIRSFIEPEKYRIFDQSIEMERELIVMDFSIDMPIFNKPIIWINIFEKVEENDEGFSKKISYNDSPKISIVQETTKRWLITYYKKKKNIFEFPIGSGKYNFVYLKYFMPKKIALKIRQAMINGGAYSTHKKEGIDNSDFYFSSPYTNVFRNVTYESLEIEKDTYKKIKNNILRNSTKDFSITFTDWYSNKVRSLEKIEREPFHIIKKEIR